MFEEDGEQAVLGTAQVHHHAAGRDEVARRKVERPAAEVIGLFRAAGGNAARFGRGVGNAPGTAQDSADARKELAGLEGLDHVIVRAEFKAHHTVGRIAEGGEENDGSGAVHGAQAAAERKAVLAGHHDIENDEVGLLFLKAGEHGFTAVRHTDLKAVLAQVVRHEVAYILIVVHNKERQRRLLMGGFGIGHKAHSFESYACTITRLKGERINFPVTIYCRCARKLTSS